MIEHAIILAGGFGTRLRPLTLRTPKPLLPVGNRPFLETQFFRLRRAGVRNVHLSVFHQSEVIRKALPGLRTFGLKIQVVREKKALGTGGAIAYAWPDLKKPCWVLNGDIMTDFEIGPMAQAHLRSRAVATLWAVEVSDTSAFGVLETSRDGKILRFLEKPRLGETQSRHINAGLYALSPDILKVIPPHKVVSVEREVFPELLRAGMDARIFVSLRASYWMDIGTLDAYREANMDVLSGKMRLDGWWKGLKGESVIARGCRISRGAEVTQSVVLSGCRIESGARVEGVVLGEGCVVAKNAVLRPGTVLGSGSHVTEGSHA